MGGHHHHPPGGGHQHAPGQDAGQGKAAGAGAASEAGGSGAHSHDAWRADHHQRRAGDRRRMLIALSLTSVLFVVEVAGGILSHSLALLSDAGHMLSDLAAQGLSLAALVIAARPSDRRRTYGYHRIEILAALANGLALFGLSLWILWSAAHRLRSGAQPVDTGLMMVIAAIGLIANLIGAWLLHGAESLNVKGAYLHVVQDTLSSVAVVLGGAVMWALSGMPNIFLLDPILSILIGLFVNFGAWRLVRDAIDVLLEAVPSGIDLQKVSASIRAETRILAVHDLHLWTITSGIFALSAHIVVDDERDQDALLGRVNQALLRDFQISHTTIQVESPRYQHECFACDVDAPSKS